MEAAGKRGMSLSELKLARRAAQGDDEALADLLRLAGPTVRSRLVGRLQDSWGSMLDIDDVMQVTYLEAFLAIGRYTHGRDGDFAAWLTTIARNNLFDAERALKSKRRRPAGRRLDPARTDSSVTLFENLMATSTTPSRYASTREACQMLKAAIEQLPADYLRVVQLYDLDGLAVAEVARRMDRSAGAVYMLRARALDRLRELLLSRVDG